MAINEEITLTVDVGNPYYVGARAYVTQTETGAVITIIDKEGTTTATIDNGVDGNDGNGIVSATLNNDYTLTLNYTDGTSTTTTSIRGEKGDSGVYVGETVPTDPDDVVWINTDIGADTVLRVKSGDTWTPIESIMGDAAGFGTVTATVDTNVGTPSVTVTSSGADTAKNFAFAFHNLGYDDSDLQSDMGVLEARMDSFTNLAEGSTTGDAELIDGRVGADGVTYTNIGDAIRGQVSDLKADLTESVKPFIGVDKATITIVSGSYYSYWDGASASNAQYENAVIAYNGVDRIIVRTNANSIAPIACYYSGTPSTLTFLGYEHAEYPAGYGTLMVNNYELSIPSGTKYIAINNKAGDGPEMLIKKESTEHTAILLNSALSRISDVEDDISAFVDITSSLTKVSGTYYNTNGYPSSNAQYESVVMAVSEGDLIQITTNGNSAAPCCGFYNGTPAHASWISNDPTNYPASYGTLSVKRYLLTIPSGTQYIAINNKIAEGAMYVYKFQPIEITKQLTSYQGKNILLLGDSITQLGMQERGWVRYFDLSVKANHIDNVAVIGAHWCDYNNSTAYNGNPIADSTEQNVIGNQVQKIINHPDDYLSDYDVVIIAAGTNDPTTNGVLTTESVNTAFFNNGAVRALTDVDRSTWAGATRWVTEKLRSLFPSAIIVYNTPINRIEGYDSARVFNNAKMVRQCAEINSTLLCDSMHCGITMSDSDDFVDGLHPSAQGAKKLGEFNAKWFAENMKSHL